eukprot:981222-Amphidinium_carterae.7
MHARTTRPGLHGRTRSHSRIKCGQNYAQGGLYKMCNKCQGASLLYKAELQPPVSAAGSKDACDQKRHGLESAAGEVA